MTGLPVNVLCSRCRRIRDAYSEDAYSPTFVCRECHFARRGAEIVAGGMTELAAHEAGVLGFVLGDTYRVHRPVITLRKGIEQLTSSLAQVPPEEHVLRAELEAMLAILNGAMARHVRTEIAACNATAKV